MPAEDLCDPLNSNPRDEADEINALGSTVRRRFVFDGDRYYFDCVHCTPEKGWAQYDTKQDAWYFGVWVHEADRQIITYAEGDITVVTSPDAEVFAAELQAMAAFHGAPPPAFVSIDTDTGQVTNHYDASAAHGRALPGSD
jgi:hypothetical protein